jgi:citrate lyase subunit beta / citryl-CoA lyase
VPSFIRRSNLMVPIMVQRFVDNVWRHNADAVTLDLEDGVPDSQKVDARGCVKYMLPIAARGGAEVFVRVNKAFLAADLEASVWPGLAGVMLSKVELAGDVQDAADQLTELERRRGIDIGSLQLIILLETALGVWNIRQIVTASPRVTQVALGEGDLCRDLAISPTEEDDPFIYARGRVVIEGIAADVQPVGMPFPLSLTPRLLPREPLLQAATMAKNLGFKGAICPHPSWIEPVNAAFSPTPEQVTYYTKVRQVFAEGVARGTAAVPLDGKMIDVPVDEWAKAVLHLAALCQARDAEKQARLYGIGEELMQPVPAP